MEDKAEEAEILTKQMIKCLEEHFPKYTGHMMVVLVSEPRALKEISEKIVETLKAFSCNADVKMC